MDYGPFNEFLFSAIEGKVDSPDPHEITARQGEGEKTKEPDIYFHLTKLAKVELKMSVKPILIEHDHPPWKIKVSEVSVHVLSISL
jgi:hypothetical protein